ncbi:MAG: molybdenum ABC transporter ATP-binding protein [Terriglobales bacterium]
MSLNVAVTKRLTAFTLDLDAKLSSGITVLFGASGSGKTTLLKLAIGLATPDRGQIMLDDHFLFDSDRNLNVPVQDRRMGMVFQNLALFPHLTAADNIAYGVAHLDSESRRKKVSAIADGFRITHILNRRPAQISGGEQQRVALARALVTEPRALLLDEPLSALDPGTKSHIMDDLRSWIADRQIPVLYVTHNREEVFAMAHRVIAIENGRIVGEGTPREVLGGAQHEAIAEWSALENVLEGTVTSTHPQQGTMTFRTGAVDLEIPLGRANSGDRVRVGVSAHDILLAVAPPQGLSARNVIEGRILGMKQRDAVVSVLVSCQGTELEVYVTPSAVQSLSFARDMKVWVVIKTHSCFLIKQ